MYGVEYYSQVLGNGTIFFNSCLDRDIWLFNLSDDDYFILFEKGK